MFFLCVHVLSYKICDTKCRGRAKFSHVGLGVIGKSLRGVEQSKEIAILLMSNG